MDLARSEGLDVYQSKSQPVPEKGFHFPPTLITNVQPTSTVVVEEVSFLSLGRPFLVLTFLAFQIFGPVLTAMPFRSPSEGMKLANNTCYGLASSVWSESLTTCLDAAFQVRRDLTVTNNINYSVFSDSGWCCMGELSQPI